MNRVLDVCLALLGSTSLSESVWDNERARRVSEAAFIHCLTSNQTTKYRICGQLTGKSKTVNGVVSDSWVGNEKAQRVSEEVIVLCLASNTALKSVSTVYYTVRVPMQKCRDSIFSWGVCILFLGLFSQGWIEQWKASYSLSNLVSDNEILYLEPAGSWPVKVALKRRGEWTLDSTGGVWEAIFDCPTWSPTIESS